MHPPDGSSFPARAPILLGIAWLAFGVAVWQLPRKGLVPLVLGGAVALQLAAGFAPPRSSDDMYRYVWDGRVQAAGIDPYRYPPGAPELAGQRDLGLWPATSSWCVRPGDVDPAPGQALAPGCTLVNRPAGHPIYPPVAGAPFWLAHRLAG